MKEKFPEKNIPNYIGKDGKEYTSIEALNEADERWDSDEVERDYRIISDEEEELAKKSTRGRW